MSIVKGSVVESGSASTICQVRIRQGTIRRVAKFLLSVAGVAAVTGCTLLPMPVPTPTPTPTPSGDGVLRIGDLVPLTGSLAGTAAAQAAGVELAAREINEQGGVLASDIEVWHRDAGDGDSARTKASFADLVSRGVDVVIAPASAEILDVLRPLAIKAGVLVIAPATEANAPVGAHTAPVVPDDDFVALLRRSDPNLSEYSFGAEAYELTVALALSASMVGDDGATSLSFALSHVQGPGISCTSFGACRSVLRTEPAIAYVGPAGPFSYEVSSGVITFGTINLPSPTKSAT